MSQAKDGDTVKVSYTGKLEDGTVFETRDSSDPLEFTIGGENVIPGFEKAVVGLAVNESKSVTIPSEQAYGSHREELVVSVDRKQLPANVTPEVGQQVEISQSDGQAVVMMIAEVHDDKITLDGNHPLSGQNLVFDIKLVEIS